MEIETPRPDGSLGPPSLAGALELVGFETDILDASVGTLADNLKDTFYRPVMQENGLIRIGITESRLRECIAVGDYGVVCINSNFTPQTKMALEVARAAKSVSRDILVIAGGVNARSLPDRFLRSGFVDAICLTEGEQIIVKMISAHLSGQDFRSLSGVALLHGGQLVINSALPSDIYTNLDDLPLPRWDKLPFVHYEQIASPHAIVSSSHRRYASIQTSLGCWAKCLYCHISKEKEKDSSTGNIGSMRFKSVDRVLREIEILRTLGVQELFIEDDSLLAKKDRIRIILKAIQKFGLKIADINGVNLVHLQKREGGKIVIDREYLQMLKDAGFDQIVFPVESASQRIIDRYATGKLKHATLDVIELVRVAKDVGITAPVNIMMGFPDETEAEMRAGAELGKRLVEAGAAYCTFFVPIPFPGSELFDLAIRNGHLDRNFDTDLFNWKRPIMKNTIVSPERVLELRDWAWEYANTREHRCARLEASAGHRWKSEASV